jgi:hypothetical protein
MGNSAYNITASTARLSDMRSAGLDTFAYTSDIRAGRAECKVHKSLDPQHVNAAGKIVRESRDSEAHPASRAIAVAFDVTGSMCRVPRI